MGEIHKLLILLNYLSSPLVGSAAELPPVVATTVEPAAENKAATYEFSGKKELAIRKLGILKITNRRGDIIVRGWSQDRIRVNYRIRADRMDFPVTAQNMTRRSLEAAEMAKTTELTLGTLPGGVEVRAKYGLQLSMMDKLMERDHPKVRMDMEILAPARMQLEIWAFDEVVALHDWRSGVSLRSGAGSVEINKLTGGNVRVNCPECKLFLKRINGDIKAAARAGKIYLEDVTANEIYCETLTGDMELNRVSGNQVLVTQNGSIVGDRLTGRVEYRSESGPILLTQISGFVSGKNNFGSTEIRSRFWRFEDRGLIESKSGSISLALPKGFSGDLDLYSLKGNVQMDFENHIPREVLPAVKKDNNLMSSQHYRGKLGDGGSELRVHSEEGDIRIYQNTL